MIMFSSKIKRFGRGLMSCGLVFCSAIFAASPARAAFHVWNLQELYSDSTGTLQFVELFTNSNTQTNFTVPRQIAVSNVGGTLTNTFTMPTSTLAATLNKTLLFGTAGLAAAGGPTPDYIIPNNFLFTGGGSINFFGANDGTYTALPTDGTQSRAWPFTGSTTGTNPVASINNAVNSPTNFAGQTGTVGVPEPSSVILVSLALGTFYSFSRRRNTQRAAGPI